MGTPITVSLIVKDSLVVESLLESLKSPALRVMAAYPGMDGAAKKLPLDPPAILLIDLDLPGGSAMAAVSWFKAKLREMRIGVLSEGQEPDFAFRAFAAGADAWFLKDEPPRQLLEGIYALQHDGPVISRAAAKRLVSHFQKRRIAVNPLETLSIRELEVMCYLAQGCSDKEIGRVLHITLTTVNDHLKRIYRKFGAHSRSEAMVKYWNLGMARNP